MKAVTEFPGFILANALIKMKSLTTEGKSPEEVQASLGEAFKFEGEKLSHFVKVLGVVGENTNNVRRVVVMTLNEGEAAPARSTKIDDFYYVVDIPVLTGSKPGQKPEPKGRGGKGGKNQDRGAKESPWGLSPEEKAAKKAKKSGTAAPTTPPAKT
jgi:hypothetical protein